MTDQQTRSTRTTRIPAPIYAAAGAGDLAYQQLRKLPTVVGEFSGRAVAGGFELRERAAASLKVANTTASSLREKAATADLDKLRDRAASNAIAFAQAAQERATAVYIALVSHGERVVGSGVVQTAGVVNADIEATKVSHPITADEATDVVAASVELPTAAKETLATAAHATAHAADSVSDAAEAAAEAAEDAAAALEGKPRAKRNRHDK